ncbi:MAG: alpha-amylase family glycosyl hydrolase [Syntrophobacteraceae bacterium]
MPSIVIHYNNSGKFLSPALHLWYPGSQGRDIMPSKSDSFGPVFETDVLRADFGFKFKDAAREGAWEGPGLDRCFKGYASISGSGMLNEIWCKADKAFIYPVQPKTPEPALASDFLRDLPLKAGCYIPGTGGLSGLGSTVLEDGRVLFGIYHPNAARVYVRGSFNGWQRPGHDQEDPENFIEMNLFHGFFGVANTWLIVTDKAKAGEEYEFCVIGGVHPDDRNRLMKDIKDPYARRITSDFMRNNSIIIDPTTYSWKDENWKSPDISSLIIYEMSVFGFTEGDPGISLSNQGRFRGITDRIQSGYFDQLGVTALSIMPLNEVPTMQGSHSLGYDPSLFMTVERDFGTPDELRELVDNAHQRGLAVILDMVFNHTSNDFNPLWQMIPEHPSESADNKGGLYFDGSSPWGNRLNTWKEDVQNMLIDSCKMFIREYHIDGFRYDATHHDDWMSSAFLHRLVTELKGFKPEVLLVAENLPNQSDLNYRGYDGYAQWCDPFHDKLKCLLREGPFDNRNLNCPDGMADVFYFSKSHFAAHTNNTVNYVTSHDETDVAYEVATNPLLDSPATKERKGRLGLFSTIVALGQPMVYMGQEFNPSRDRNLVRFDWPDNLSDHGFFQWARRLIRLRKRYPALKLHGYAPADEGQLAWILGPWLSGNLGGGRKVIGWRSTPNHLAHETMIVLINFENQDVTVDVDLGIPGKWVKLADIDYVNDIPPEGTNSGSDSTALHSGDGWFGNFRLPSSSGFIYKCEWPWAAK